MGAVILPDLGTEILIPVCAIIGIAFALFQWVLVSKVKLSAARDASSNAGGGKNGYNDYLIEEEEGLNDHNVVLKCAEIQNAISEGLSLSRAYEIYPRVPSFVFPSLFPKNSLKNENCCVGVVFNFLGRSGSCCASFCMACLDFD